jgi:hypothetical protein
MSEMDDTGFDELPRAYRIGLRLRALGADDELIADCLEIDPDGIVTLLDIGARKLDHLRRAVLRSDSAASRTTGHVDQKESLQRKGRS